MVPQDPRTPPPPPRKPISPQPWNNSCPTDLHMNSGTRCSSALDRRCKQFFGASTEVEHILCIRFCRGMFVPLFGPFSGPSVAVPVQVRQYLHATADKCDNWNEVTSGLRDSCARRQQELQAWVTEQEQKKYMRIMAPPAAPERPSLGPQEDQIRRDIETKCRNDVEEEIRRRDQDDMRRRELEDQELRAESQVRRLLPVFVLCMPRRLGQFCRSALESFVCTREFCDNPVSPRFLCCTCE